jgi:hypothetical protein
MPDTKGSLLRFSIWYALGRVKVHIGRRFYPLGLPDSIRTQIAADVVNDMRRHAQWPELDEALVMKGPTPSWLDEKIASAKTDDSTQHG